MPIDLENRLNEVGKAFYSSRDLREDYSSSSSDEESQKKKNCKKSKDGGKIDEDFDEKAEKAVCADVRMLSGCKDEQTSADVNDVRKLGWSATNRGAGGACTNALLKSLKEGPTTWIGLLRRMRENLKHKKFVQIPQLSTSRKLDLDSSFRLMFNDGGGKHRALLIGINYVGQKAELSGCHNDVAQIKELIMKEGFTDSPETMKILCDDGEHDDPTAKNLVNAFSWLIEEAEEGDSLFMHYSGHGGTMPDEDGDEADGQDETMVPLDYLNVGHIIDDDLYKMIVAPLPSGVNLTIIMDCCHSGSIIDLPYVLSMNNELVTCLDEGGATPSMEPNSNFSLRKLFSALKRLYHTSRQEGVTYHEIGQNIKKIFGF
mmetsp:Transcript_20429/g.30216  ORF Transcript_20429/g.30216 Transcript_20429/m.30216 type:complete len:373 (-) Transcript_20429:68-1186(-)|eukprot:CAMPEP_0171462286 /NCGR_PEP_ID=MMETSP0945-20130129/6381_1 /TAXON_ID=109269 /ORGANISM="Vaucheria litorea, Strain CCMP2940" /LENGTH=372 /DNA_ID=CAMNT_0011988775 /DNA_START=20 /DNA_END=1138 /DNA_ORIENTATION=-